MKGKSFWTDSGAGGKMMPLRSGTVVRRLTRRP
jgi:hypothetical protein